MKHYLLPNTGNYYKASLHTHTSLSDGQLSPEEAKRKYMDLGYSIVAYTDHEILVPHNDLTDESFLAITSFEVSVSEQHHGAEGAKKCYHLNLYAKDPARTDSAVFSMRYVWNDRMKALVAENAKSTDYRRFYSTEAVNDLIRTANGDGFLVSYNHPVWSLQRYPDYIDLEGLWGIEVFNTGCFLGGWVETTQPFCDLLSKNKRLFPLCTDDSHKEADCGGGWVMVNADRLEYGAVMDSLERGDFYSSTGPEIREFYVEDNVAHISCSEAVSITILSERRSVVHAGGSAENPLTEVTLDLSRYLSRTNNVDFHPAKPYIRLEIIDKYGKTAYTRAYEHSEFREGN